MRLGPATFIATLSCALACSGERRQPVASAADGTQGARNGSPAHGEVGPLDSLSPYESARARRGSSRDRMLLDGFALGGFRPEMALPDMTRACLDAERLTEVPTVRGGEAWQCELASSSTKRDSLVLQAADGRVCAVHLATSPEDDRTSVRAFEGLLVELRTRFGHEDFVRFAAGCGTARECLARDGRRVEVGWEWSSADGQLLALEVSRSPSTHRLELSRTWTTGRCAGTMRLDGAPLHLGG